LKGEDIDPETGVKRPEVDMAMRYCDRIKKKSKLLVVNLYSGSQLRASWESDS
jgi:predicted transcriptional regulator